MLKRGKERYERHLEGQNEMRRKSSVTVKTMNKLHAQKLFPMLKMFAFFVRVMLGTDKVSITY